MTPGKGRNEQEYGTLMVSCARDHRPHYVYQFWSKTECLYVGVTASPPARFTGHYGKPWFDQIARYEVTVHQGRVAGLDAERALIVKLQPVHNVLLKRRLA